MFTCGKRRHWLRMFYAFITCVLLKIAYQKRVCIHERGVLHTQECRESGSSGYTDFITQDDVPTVEIHGANCDGLFRGNPKDIATAMEFQKSHPRSTQYGKEALVRMVMQCERFKAERRYLMKPVDEEEAMFPIAFFIGMYKDPEQVETLLRMIYRPQNHYMIHIDKKANESVKETMRALVSCFDNVHLTSQSIDIKWGQFSVLEAVILAMRDLWNFQWKYFINLTGQEVPLKTNLELVKILKAFNGANCIEFYPNVNHGRTAFKLPAPQNVTVFKSSIYIAVRREYVDFLLHDPKAHQLLDWVNGTAHPDETYFALLNFNPHLGVAGAYTGKLRSNHPSNPWVGRYCLWAGQGNCTNKYVRAVCIFGVGDLHKFAKNKELFANKFYYCEQPLAYDCMEQRYFQRLLTEVREGKTDLNISFYKSLDFAKHHLR